MLEPEIPSLLAEKVLQAMIDSPQDVIVLLDRQATILLANRTLLERRSMQAEQVIGRSLWEIFPPKVEAFGRMVFERAVATGEFAQVSIEGYYGTYDVILNPIRDEHGQVIQVAVAARDITQMAQIEQTLAYAQRDLERRIAERTLDLCRLNQELRDEIERRSQAEVRWRESAARAEALSQKLLLAQENERRRLGRSLHDEIGQMLTLLGMTLQKAGQDAELPALTLDALQAARQMVGELLQQVREKSLELRPSLLDDLGLIPALQAQVKRFSDTTGIPVDLRYMLDPTRRYPDFVEIAVFRMLQEALTNIIRHARARQVTIRLWEDGRRLSLQIEDDGAGFNPHEIDPSDSTGLSGMRERVILIGGSLEIDSEAGYGTCLTAEFPLSRPTPPGQTDSLVTGEWYANQPAAG